MSQQQQTKSPAEMKRQECIERFAKMSFEVDKNLGLYEAEENFDNIDNDELDIYLEEAEYYVDKIPQEEWPVDILSRWGN